MDFALSQKHAMARDLFRSFAQNEVKPLAQEIDEEERFPNYDNYGLSMILVIIDRDRRLLRCTGRYDSEFKYENYLE